MNSSLLAQAARDYAVVEKALASLNLAPPQDPLIQRWAGTDAHAFLDSLTITSTRELLQKSLAGTVRSSRLDPDLDISCEVIQPGAPGSLKIRYGTHPTPFGDALIGISDRGICALHYGADLSQLKAKWPKAEFTADPAGIAEVCKKIFLEPPSQSHSIPLHLRGTRFQIEVWLALLSLPSGSLASYQSIADSIGRPASTRAVASAIAKNEICFLVPCHRVIQQGGGIGGFRWGVLRKKAMIGWETASEMKGPQRPKRPNKSG